eukprot:TRINITY_DN520_c0_g1_i3.p1 TRINITY_DN520_c0_g1~~TRINITY_DN520_c0_g1_i3.p1  ORF type:complete len:362 (-),score=10.91 TRINITY_DN520_c0_g1_i3:800-1885(-)
MATVLGLTLPDEIWLKILDYLHLPDIISVSECCRCFYHFVQEDEIWKALFLLRFPGRKLTREQSWKHRFISMSTVARKVARNKPRILKLSGHKGPIFNVVFDPEDQHTLMTASGDRGMRIWSAARGKSIREFPNVHSAYVRGLQFDREKIVSSGNDNMIKIWGRCDGLLRSTISSHQNCVFSIQYDDRHLVSGGNDSLIKIHDLSTRLEIASLTHHTASVRGVQFDDHTLVSCSNDHSAAVWDRRTYRLVGSLKQHTDFVTSVSFSNRHIVTSSNDQTIVLWDFRMMSAVGTLVGHTQAVFWVKMNHSVAASGGNDELLRLWDLRTLQQTRKLKQHTSYIYCVNMEGSTVCRIVHIDNNRL